MKNLFNSGLDNYTFYEEVSTTIVKSGLTGKEVFPLIETEMNARLSALQVQFEYMCPTCVSCTFITSSSRFILTFTVHDIFDFVLSVTHVLIAYALGKGIKVVF